MVRAVIALLVAALRGRIQDVGTASRVTEAERPHESTVTVTVNSELRLPDSIVQAIEASQLKEDARDVRDRMRLLTEAIVGVTVVAAVFFSWVQIAATRRA